MAPSVQADGSLRLTLAQNGFLDRDLVMNVDDVSMASTVVLAQDGEQIVAMASLCQPLPPERANARAPIALKILERFGL